MNRDTPLPEAVVLLPTQAAALLVDQHPVVQELVVASFRRWVCDWEDAGVQLDPVEFDVIVSTVVRELITAYRETVALIEQEGT